MMGVKFYADRQPWGGGIAIHMAVADQSGDRLSIAQPVTMKAEDQAAAHHQPMMVLDIRGAQQLMDELWHCGLRPTEGTGSAGSLAATERHLEDMRRLVFKGAHQALAKGGAA